jgi:hypothetical protein
MGGCDSSSSTDFKPKLYNAMESNDGHDPSQQTAEGNSIDKGKGIDIGNTGSNEDSAAKPLDKGKGIDKRLHPIELGPGHCTEPPFVT